MNILGKAIQKISVKRARQVVPSLLPWLTSGSGKMLDFGCGLGHIGFLLAQSTGRSIEYLDVKQYPFTQPGIFVRVFDGTRIPYSDKEFDTSLVIFILHHVPDPTASLREVARVSKQLIVCEDLIKSRREIPSETVKDIITNCFLPHMTLQYKTESEWEQLYASLGLDIRGKVYFSSTYIFRFKHVSWLLSN